MNRLQISTFLMLAMTTACSADGRDPGTTAANTGTTVDTSETSDGTTGNDDSSSSGSATTGSDDSTGGSTGDDGSVFLNMDVAEGGECDPFTQDCPDGQKCMPWANDGGNSWNANKCAPVVENPGQVGDPCTPFGNGVTGEDDCDAGLMCYNVQIATGQGTCYELCGGSAGSPSCDTEGTTCQVYNDGVLPLCLWTCDPILQDCAGPDLCLSAPDGENFVCILDSLPDDEGGYGTPCQYINTCDPGLFCGVASIVPGCTDSGCCSEFCDLAISDPDSACSGAAGGQKCLPWWGEADAPPGYDHVGFCGIPT